MASTLDDVLLPVLPSCPHPHFDKNNTLVARQWWLDININSDSTEQQQQYKRKDNYINDLESPQTSTTISSPSYQSFGKSYIDNYDFDNNNNNNIYDNHNNNNNINDDDHYQEHDNLWDKQIQVWFDRITTHERILLNEGLREFIESEVGVSFIYNNNYDDDDDYQSF